MRKKPIDIKYLPSLRKVFFIGAIVLFSGCLGVKNSTGNSGKNLFETFYVGNDGTQYFIKPLTFNDEDKNQLKLDVTFRYKDRVKDSALVNISFINNDLFRNVDSLKISNDSVSVVFNNFKCLFAERIQKKFNSRFSTKGSLVETTKLFNKNNWNIIVYRQNKYDSYYSPNETKKKINKLKYGIFMLF
jgi:hypothetical protein